MEAGPVVGIEEQVEVEESHHQVGEHLGGNDDNHDNDERNLHRIGYSGVPLDVTYQHHKVADGEEFHQRLPDDDRHGEEQQGAGADDQDHGQGMEKEQRVHHLAVYRQDFFATFFGFLKVLVLNLLFSLGHSSTCDMLRVDINLNIKVFCW